MFSQQNRVSAIIQFQKYWKILLTWTASPFMRGGVSISPYIK